MPRPVTLFAAMSLMLAGCAGITQKDGLTYRAPKSAMTDTAVAVPGASQADAVASLAVRLREAGLRVVKEDRRTGTVVARVAGPALVDCGTFTQSARGNVVQFPAHAARAVLFDFAKPGNLIQREAMLSSQVKVTVASAAPFTATQTATHDVRVSQRNLSDADKDWRAHGQFISGQRVLFPDGVSCVDNGRLASIVAGP